MQVMARLDNKFGNASVATALLVVLAFGTVGALAQQAVPRDPAEPAQVKLQPKILPRPGGAITRQSVDEKVMRALINEQVSCGTRLTLSSWTDPKRGAGCGRDFIVARFNAIAKESGGKLQVVVDKFEMTSERTGAKPVHLENVYGILPGSDPQLAKTIFIVSGHFDSRPSNVMDPQADAPGADDDASGVAGGGGEARLLCQGAAKGAAARPPALMFSDGFWGEHVSRARRARSREGERTHS